MFDIRRRNSVKKLNNHFAFNDWRNNRIECFTDLDTSIYDKDFITLRTGKFKVSRNDNVRGNRYFINDFRSLQDEPNAVLLIAKRMIDLAEEHEIIPLYTRDDINIYQIGEYNHPQVKKRLVITQTDIYEEKLYT